MPLFTYTLSPSDVHQAIENETQPPLPSQVCDACAPGVFQHYGYLVADQGWCSQCHGRGECLDVALIEYYRQCGIDDETINDHLPRKRWNSQTGGTPMPINHWERLKSSTNMSFSQRAFNVITYHPHHKTGILALFTLSSLLAG
ncbi:hypothetical protein [Enterovibrio norvegicus]|uniref:hypothetical protein n=1 Tax=Enterovibrio norvegicus TaxID=188144 RepID=UPI0039AF14A8